MSAGSHGPSRLVVRDGQEWILGADAEVARIRGGTTITHAVTAAVPPVFEAYGTVLLPEDWQAQQAAHDAALIDVLAAHSQTRSWWLGYLDTGADDIVFPDAPPVGLYAHGSWRYVLVQAGPEQALSWRQSDGATFWKGALPNLMFPSDRAWLTSTLWDDDWTCVGGSRGLLADLLTDPVLGARSRLVTIDQDATPPGHESI